MIMTLPLPTYEPQYAQFANHQQKDVLYHAATRKTLHLIAFCFIEKFSPKFSKPASRSR